MAEFELKHLSADECRDAKKAWEAIAGQDAFDVELAPFFTWVDTHITPKESDSVALQLANVSESGRVDAIVEVVNSRGGALSKLLKVVLSPMFWDVNNCREQIVELYTQVFTHFSTVNNGVSSRKVKIYGRDDDMLSILRTLHSHWAVPRADAEFEGRFLAITFR